MIALSTSLQATVCSYLSIKQRFAVLSRVSSSFRTLSRHRLSWGDRDEYITFARGNPTAAFMLDRLRLQPPAIAYLHQLWTVDDEMLGTNSAALMGAGDSAEDENDDAFAIGDALGMPLLEEVVTSADALQRAEDRLIAHFTSVAQRLPRLQRLSVDSRTTVIQLVCERVADWFPHLRALTLHDQPYNQILERAHGEQLRRLTALRSLCLHNVDPGAEIADVLAPLPLTAFELHHETCSATRLLAAFAKHSAPLTRLVLHCPFSHEIALAPLSHLETLSCAVSELWCHKLPAALPASLRSLSLHDPHPDARSKKFRVDLQPLSELSNLHSLSLSSLPFADWTWVVPLMRCARLRSLRLHALPGTACVSAEAIDGIGRLTQLESVQLSADTARPASVSDDWKRLRLTELAVEQGGGLTGECLAVFAAMPLRSLSLEGMRDIEDKHLEPFMATTTLRKLTVNFDRHSLTGRAKRVWTTLGLRPPESFGTEFTLTDSEWDTMMLKWDMSM